jgi:hypothetical protein
MKFIIYQFTNKIFRIFIFFSVYLFFFLKKNKNKYCVQDVNTYGDSVIFYDFIRLKNINNKKKYIPIVPNFNLPLSIARIFFKEKEYVVYRQYIYLALIFILNLYYFLIKKKNGSLLIDLNNILIVELKKRIYLKYNQNISFYSIYDPAKDINLIKNKSFFSKSFVESYISTKQVNNVFPMLKEYFHLRSKFGPFSINFSESKILLETLKITKKYVCLFIRPYPDRGTYSFKKDFETDPRANYDLNSFFATINFLFKNDYQIVLMGNFNNKFVNNKIFKKCINYRNSIYQNPKNDFIITQNCDFAIAAQGGYVVVPPVLGIPTLVINNVYLAGLYNYKKIMYHPKYFIKNKIKYLKLRDIMKSPIFFEFSKKLFNLYDITTRDINSNDLLSSVKNFHFMVKKNDFFYKSNKINLLKKYLNPLHLRFNLSFKSLMPNYLDKNF